MSACVECAGQLYVFGSNIGVLLKVLILIGLFTMDYLSIGVVLLLSAGCKGCLLVFH